MSAYPASHRGRGKIWTDLKVCPYNCYEILCFAQNDKGEMLRMTRGEGLAITECRDRSLDLSELTLTLPPPIPHIPAGINPRWMSAHPASHQGRGKRSSVENISFLNYNAQDDYRLPHPRGAVGNKGEAR